MKRYLLLLSIVVATSLYSQDKLNFASVFSDNMVLQQDTVVKIWGIAQPSTDLTLSCSWLAKDIPIQTDKTGYWSASVKTPKADLKEHTITLKDSANQQVVLSNILLGEVWICGGQSNMEMILAGIPSANIIVEGSEEEIANANYPNLRFLNVKRKESFVPINNITTDGWKVFTPENVKWLSAVGYYFAKRINNSLNTPVGLIVNAYGGSPIQSWIPDSIIQTGEIYSKVKNEKAIDVEASNRSEEEYLKEMRQWIDNAEKRTVSTVYGKERTVNLPANMEQLPTGNQLGEVQFSKTILLDTNQTTKDLIVSLGTLDDLGMVFFNGELVWEELHNSKSYSKVNFTIPASKLKQGANTIDVKVLNILWGGGLTGTTQEMYYTQGCDDRHSLTGEWLYKKIFDIADASLLPSEGKAKFSTPSALYNGMLYPLLGYTIKGCLWYQGEANLDDADIYTQMSVDMITAWRKGFDKNMPFYYTEIAPYCYGNCKGVQLSKLREAQLLVKGKLTNSGMIFTIDLGDADNIHPPRKREVGERLANLALVTTYKKKASCKYPVVKSIKRNKKGAVLTLDYVSKGILFDPEMQTVELSADGKEYYSATVHLIATNKLQVSANEVATPCYIRYCWHNRDVGTITNSDLLPLAAFSKEIK